MEESGLKEPILELKNAIFYSDRVSIRAGKIHAVLRIEDIDYIGYNKPSFFSYFMGATSRAYLYPGYLWIKSKIKIKGPKRLFAIKIKYEQIFKLPDNFKKFLRIFW